MTIYSVTSNQANNIAKFKKSFIGHKDKFPNISQSEREEIYKKHISNCDKAMTFTMKIMAGLAVAMGTTYIGIYTGKCDKIINNILQLSCKPVDILKEFIEKSAKATKSKQIIFDKARAHLHQENIINSKGLVSGAHEIKNLIQTLTKNNGNIISIRESKTQNGIWEIIYEIGGKISNEPKTVYLEQELSSEVIENLINLCKKHNNQDLEKQFQNLIHSKKTYNDDSMRASIERALKEGIVIRGESLEKSTQKAKQEISILEQQVKKLKSELKKAEETFNNTQNAIAKAKQKTDFNPASDEFKALLDENKKAKQMQRKLKGNLESVQEKFNKQKIHCEHVENSVNIYGENNGKLYAAFAHNEDGKLIVDSYFPISHGSKMQNEFLKERSKASSLSFLDFKYLIGAKRQHMHQFEKKLIQNLIKKFRSIPKYATYIGIPAGSAVGIATNFELEKLNKERENINNKKVP